MESVGGRREQLLRRLAQHLQVVLIVCQPLQHRLAVAHEQGHLDSWVLGAEIAQQAWRIGTSVNFN